MLDVAVWNVLHDGRIVAIDETAPGTLRVSIEIAYLCRQLETAAQYLIVEFSGCRRFEFSPYEPQAEWNAGLASVIGLDILSARSGGGYLAIECADTGAGGQLFADYDDATVSTAEGEVLSQLTLEQASDQYWSNWQRNRKGNR